MSGWAGASESLGRSDEPDEVEEPVDGADIALTVEDACRELEIDEQELA